ncbi:GH116 family glycosyl hydrolase [Vibrio chaetopteri]|uniref:GH116 family glycosyl hydrolase n=1 Tax=Vibrio chaetopteri TaxID=3016528 RepID=UPI003AB3B6CA
MILNIENTTYKGTVNELCAKGNAVEFIQPWYVPISTTPDNTGMAVGGIGSAFTLTPLGSTPNFSFVPGIFIDVESEELNFNDFHVSVMDIPTVENLAITDLDGLIQYLKYYPVVLNGKIATDISRKDIESEIKRSLIDATFYSENKDGFLKWNVEFSDKTLHNLELDANSVSTQVRVAVDFFDGHLVNNTAQLRSLNAVGQSAIESVAREDIHYQAMYPIAQYQYSSFEDIKLTRNVVSPIVKGDKTLCSLPLHWNLFSVENSSNETKVVTIVQPLTNLIGSTYRKGRDGVQDSFCTLTQNPIDQSHRPVTITTDNSVFKGVAQTSQSPYASDIEGEVCFGVQSDSDLLKSGKVTVSIKPSLYITQSQKALETSLKTGRTNQLFDKGIYSGRECLQGLVCVQVELEPGQTVDLRFVQVMDHSKISLDGWESRKSYAQFYQESHPAQSILKDTLPKLSDIEHRIVSQQEAFYQEAQANFESSESAARFTTMAMNTLSFLAESTVWDCQDKFLVKECVDYPFFNSLDVYFYGSFSLLYLLPELDGVVMREFADAIMASDPTKRRYWEYAEKPNAELCDTKYEGVRAIKGAVIHDLGSPYDIQPDAYDWHNVKEWKDLAPKYILMVYRHYVHSNDLSVVQACWPAIVESVEYLTALIEEGDTLPLTRGTDDTFDNLASHGISIYCASLWSAGLKAASKLAKLMEENDLADWYQQRSSAALDTLERALWDERNGYYHFFATPVQAKHLTGQTNDSLQSLGLTLTGDKTEDKKAINAYLDSVDLESELSMFEQRVSKKHRLLELAPDVFTTAYKDILLDSDNSFGDALLADSYLKLIGDKGLFEDDKVARTLDYIYRTNFRENSPKLGVANMTLCDGAPHDAFQAQDVWIGVQFSTATALKLAGKQQQAEALIDSVYTALYHYAKIPFAAPEGFNCSVAVSQSDLVEQFGVAESTAEQWLQSLKATNCILTDGRVNPDLTSDFAEFRSVFTEAMADEQAVKLHTWLLNTGLKYTAGRYFRPGMIFSYLY